MNSTRLTADTTFEAFMGGESPSSYQGRIKSRRVLDQVSKKIAYQHAYRPTNASTLSQFLRLKQEDAQIKTTAAPSYVSGSTSGDGSWASKLMDDESNELYQQLQAQTADQYIQNFYNAYMSPANSDICWRLGTVTKTKHNSGFFDDRGNPVQTESSIYAANGSLTNTAGNFCEVLGQTDRFGRIDTVSNLRVEIKVEPNSRVRYNGQPLTPGYSEYYVNWYFPPYNASVFDLNAINKAQLAATKKAANEKYKVAIASAQSAVDKARAESINISTLTKMAGLSEDKSSIPTFDPIELMCSRDGFTYRTAGFKAINDNISFLQHIFEECTGIVSTYLTEWDLSLYMQEGLLAEHSSGTVWLCNRMEEDNPQGLTGKDALVWGVVNSAVSKIPVGGTPASEVIWNPQSYYLSAYWWPYNLVDRGDGLDKFWDHATQPIDSSRNIALRETFLGKIKYDDYVHAAYAGWTTFNDMKFYQALYAAPGEELTMVDIVHTQESNASDDDETYSSLVNELKAIQDAMYAENPELGWKSDLTTVYEPGHDPNWHLPGGIYERPLQISGVGLYNHKIEHYVYDNAYDSESRRLDYTDYYMNENYITSIDASNNKVSKNTNTVSIGGEGNISILGAEIPGSSMLKVFLKRNKYKSSALGIAAKTQNGFGSFGSKANGSSGEADADGNVPTLLGDLFTKNKDENSRYSNPLGVPRLGPALFGGPHGAFASPQTMQAYFDADNPFLLSVPRINPAIRTATNDFSLNDKAAYYKGIEASYMYPAGRGSKQCYIGRSPSDTLHLLNNGYCEIVQGAPLNVLRTINRAIEGTPSFSFYTSDQPYARSAVIVYVRSNSFPSYISGGRVSYYGSIYSGSTIYTTKIANGNYSYYNGSYTNTNRNSYIVGVDCRRDGIYVRYRKPVCSGQYEAYVSENYNRPLLHCIPYNAPKGNGNPEYSRWIIAKYSKTISPDVTTREGSFKEFIDAWGSGDPAVRECSQYQMMRRIAGENQSNEKYYRLTMPYFDSNYKNVSESVMQQWLEDFEPDNDYHGDAPSSPPAHVTWTDRYTPEKEVVGYMLKNPTGGGSPWTNLMYCYSAPNDSSGERNSKGPRAIVQIPTRLQSDTVTCKEFIGPWVSNCRHKPRCKPCHRDYACAIYTYTKTYYYIEVDVDNAKNLWAAANWSKIYSPNICGKDIMTDIPSQDYRVPVANSVWDLLHDGPAPKRFRFAGTGFTENDAGDDGGQYLTGWGIYSALPCLQRIPGQSTFEDANEILWLGDSARSTAIRDLNFGVPIFNDTGGSVRYIDGKYFYNPKEQNRQSSYSKGNGDVYDPGYMEFMRTFYSSCTLFVPENRSVFNSMAPFTVDISNCIVSAMKLLEHQKAYLRFGKQLFKDTIEAEEVIRIIERCIDKRIVRASIKKYASRNTNSIYYNPWIDKAYDLYSSKGGTAAVLNAFDDRIQAMDIFLDRAETFMQHTSAPEVDMISAKNWSWNDYLECYGVFKSFEGLCTGLDSAVDEYFYSYLNVLYEYRRFYINKRCNKQDGTLWTCRAFESVMPFMNGASNEEAVDMGAVVENASTGVSSYSITMKGLTNNALDKGKAIATGVAAEPDRIKRLFMPCKPVTETAWRDFVTGKSDKEVIRLIKPDPNDKRYSITVYYEKPVDGTYQLVSTEYLANKTNKDYNTVMENLRDSRLISDSVYRSKCRSVNNEIEDCIFPIVWIKQPTSDELNAYLDSAKTLKEAANAQAEANKFYIAKQEEQVEETEKQTKILQAQEQIVENWRNTVSNANQCITAYNDYGEPYFWSTANLDAQRRADDRFRKLMQMVDLYKVRNASGAEQAELKKVYKSTYNLTDAQVNAHVKNGFETAGLNFRNEPDVYTWFVKDFTAVDESGKELTDVVSDSEYSFILNIEEIYSKVAQYRDAKTNLKSYTASYEDSQKVLKDLEKSAKAALDNKQRIVNNAKNAYDKAVANYNAAVNNQAEKAKAYESIRNSEGQQKTRESRYTWVEHTSDESNLYPNILYNLISSVDPSKLNSNSRTMSPETTMCSSSKFIDYWVITLDNPPRDIGYDTRLKIKTYETNIHDTNSFKANMATTVAGAFAYSLYPITEDQAGAIASIGATLTDAEKMIRDTYS